MYTSFFPQTIKFNELQIDDIGKYSITTPAMAEKISSIIKKFLKGKDIDTIIDCTAGVGGNIFSFAQIAKQVFAIEIDSTRVSILENNINVYGIENVKTIVGDAVFILPEILAKQPSVDVIFFDPPWGGKDYKMYQSLDLKLGSNAIEDLVIEIIQYFPKVGCVAVKLPLNISESALQQLRDKLYVEEYSFRKMLLVVCKKIKK